MSLHHLPGTSPPTSTRHPYHHRSLPHLLHIFLPLSQFLPLAPYPPLTSTLPSLPCPLLPTPLLPILSLQSTDTPPTFLPALSSYLPHSSFPAEISAFPLPHQPLPNAPAISLPSYQPPPIPPPHPAPSLSVSPIILPSPLLPPPSPICPASPTSTLHPLIPITTPPLSRYSTRSTNGITAPRLRHQHDSYRTLLSTSSLSPDYHLLKLAFSVASTFLAQLPLAPNL